MENASKALIIAGAILISIVIISLGVVIIGQGQDVVNQSNMDDQVVSSWNQKWMQYEGTNVSGSTLNTVINQVISSNVVADRDGEVNKVIQLACDASKGTAAYRPQFTNTYTGLVAQGLTNAGKSTANYGTSSCSQKAKPGVFYTVQIKYNKDGYVSQIYISANS